MELALALGCEVGSAVEGSWEALVLGLGVVPSTTQHT